MPRCLICLEDLQAFSLDVISLYVISLPDLPCRV